MKRGIAGFFIFVLLAAGVVGCGGAVEPEVQETGTAMAPTATATAEVGPSETVTVEASPIIIETIEVEETPVADETPLVDKTPPFEVTVTPLGVEMSEDLPQVEMAKADLAERLNVAPETIEVVQVEARVWPDAGMGCPQPGMVYTQVPQDGLLIRFGAGGQVYDYHSGGTRDPFLCEEGGKETPEFGEEIIPPPSMDE